MGTFDGKTTVNCAHALEESEPDMRTIKEINLTTLLQKCLAGAAFGGAFGVFFGATASVFQGGPELFQGIRESAPWFGTLGAIAGSVIGLEKQP